MNFCVGIIGWWASLEIGRGDGLGCPCHAKGYADRPKIVALPDRVIEHAEAFQAIHGVYPTWIITRCPPR